MVVSSFMTIKGMSENPIRSLLASLSQTKYRENVFLDFVFYSKTLAIGFTALFVSYCQFRSPSS
jgi:hypothetical protein